MEARRSNTARPLNRTIVGSLLFLATILHPAAACAADQRFDESLLKNGDIIFQTSRSAQSQAIQVATRSRYSHCGLIFIQSGKPFVFEASARIRQTPFERFVAKGDGKKFVIKRLKNADSVLTTGSQKKLEAEGKKFAGLPYDAFFGWGDDRIYCSELVYKIYRNALGIEIGKPARLREFDLSNPKVRAKLNQRYHGRIPLDETVISPAAQFEDPKLIEIFNNYGS